VFRDVAKKSVILVCVILVFLICVFGTDISSFRLRFLPSRISWALMSIRRREAKSSTLEPRTLASSLSIVTNDTVTSESLKRLTFFQVAPALLDFYTVLSLVFGGCCSNVLTYEQLLIMNPRIGSALTFSQMLFITAQSLPSFISISPSHFLPRLKPRQVPLTQWALQVLVLTSGSLLNNWAFAYNVPLTILIVFRSGGLPVSVFFGYYFLQKRYNMLQTLSIVIITSGVVLATLSRTATTVEVSNLKTAEDLQRYIIGIGMMVVSLLCTGLLGLLQERTYGKYGPCWREGIFYTHFLSLPFFAFLGRDIKQGLSSMSNPQSTTSTVTSFIILFGNLITQLMCVSGVNRLSSEVSSVSTNIALTARKAFSLCFSVWWFGNEWNMKLGAGAFMVFCGSFIYTLSTERNNKTS